MQVKTWNKWKRRNDVHLLCCAEMPGLSCRFYQHRFPEVEDVVMVNVRSIAEMGAYVSLLEYNNIEGMILLSELSRRRIRSINKLIRIGRNECVVVIRVDKEKGECHRHKHQWMCGGHQSGQREGWVSQRERVSIIHFSIWRQYLFIITVLSLMADT